MKYSTAVAGEEENARALPLSRCDLCFNATVAGAAKFGGIGKKGWRLRFGAHSLRSR